MINSRASRLAFFSLCFLSACAHKSASPLSEADSGHASILTKHELTFRDQDRNRDGYLGRQEVEDAFGNLFESLDSNHDEVLTGAEIPAALSKDASPRGGKLDIMAMMDIADQRFESADADRDRGLTEKESSGLVLPQ
jgi:hypothetical protein